jgi:hypothetical protein
MAAAGAGLDVTEAPGSAQLREELHAVNVEYAAGDSSQSRTIAELSDCSTANGKQHYAGLPADSAMAAAFGSAHLQEGVHAVKDDSAADGESLAELSCSAAYGMPQSGLHAGVVAAADTADVANTAASSAQRQEGLPAGNDTPVGERGRRC